MPKKHRISHSDFKLAASLRLRRERGKYFMLSYGPLAGKEGAGPQFACVVSKKTAARAVDRNLIKRRCRAAAGNAVANSKIPLAYIFYANKNAKTASFPEIRQDVAQLIENAMSRKQQSHAV